MKDMEKLQNKSGQWLFKKVEDKSKEYLIPKIPSFIETYHLTFLTLLWSAGMFLSFYFAKQNDIFLWLVPLFVILQYISDTLDGALGRYRNTGLVGWGYYVDHFLDFVFMTSIILGYGLVIGFSFWVLIVYALISAFMVHSFLLVSTLNNFHISFLGIGPTESRLLFIIFHIIIIYKNIFVLNSLIPYLTVVLTIGLIWVSVLAQVNLWRTDMENKK
ncbi:hypothetical protein C0583_00460 [Candidatus Parcubacteria bacterium]|nr:MAG: hypothetical protein C0583_00460 [Candidatus Parcubacteria bacterium]